RCPASRRLPGARWWPRSSLGVLLPPVYWIGFTSVAVLVALGGVQTTLVGRGRSLLPWIRYREQPA
ncbi:MAG: hypothetical protein M3Z25_23530, partial [Actinomycetota bacterium]|nr:hypothetical protein [Actinomycetota bacterium]